jgi:hypothetical protein
MMVQLHPDFSDPDFSDPSRLGFAEEIREWKARRVEDDVISDSRI